MKYFIENGNGKTLFFIDELGGGSDPNLGGAFAELSWKNWPQTFFWYRYHALPEPESNGQ